MSERKTTVCCPFCASEISVAVTPASMVPAHVIPRTTIQCLMTGSSLAELVLIKSNKDKKEQS